MVYPPTLKDSSFYKDIAGGTCIWVNAILKFFFGKESTVLKNSGS